MIEFVSSEDTTKESKEDLFTELRHQEMMLLFAKKSYQEGTVISENKNRAYIKLNALNNLSATEDQNIITQCEATFSIFKSSIHFYGHNGEKFIVVEPLTTVPISKEEMNRLMCLIKNLLS